MSQTLGVMARLSALTFVLTSMLAMVATVLLSVVLHGISANPGVKLYTRSIANLEPDAPEYAEVGANR